MLGNSQIMAFVPTQDSNRARAFYEGVLGLRFISDDPFALVMEAAGTSLRIAKTENFVAAPFTILGWQVADIQSTMTHLKARGVVGMRYDFLAQDPLGIWQAPGGAQVAWFKDPDGNLLSVTES